MDQNVAQFSAEFICLIQEYAILKSSSWRRFHRSHMKNALGNPKLLADSAIYAGHITVSVIQDTENIGWFLNSQTWINPKPPNL